MCGRGLDVDEGLEDTEDFAHFLRRGADAVAGTVSEESAATSREWRVVEVVVVGFGGGLEDVICAVALAAGAFDAAGTGGGGGGDRGEGSRRSEGVVFVGDGGCRGGRVGPVGGRGLRGGGGGGGGAAEF